MTSESLRNCNQGTWTPFCFPTPAAWSGQLGIKEFRSSNTNGNGSQKPEVTAHPWKNAHTETCSSSTDVIWKVTRNDTLLNAKIITGGALYSDAVNVHRYKTVIAFVTYPTTQIRNQFLYYCLSQSLIKKRLMKLTRCSHLQRLLLFI